MISDEHNNANLNVIDITKFKYEHNSLSSKKYEKVIKQIKNDASFLIYSNIYSDEVTKSILPLDDSI